MNCTLEACRSQAAQLVVFLLLAVGQIVVDRHLGTAFQQFVLCGKVFDACRLELQTRNNGKLMATLEEVLGRLELPEDTQELLEQINLDSAKYAQLALSHTPLLLLMTCAVCS